MVNKVCHECEFCFMKDYGYSNWTVEGTTAYCMLKLHPSGREGYDNWYGEDDRAKFAEECTGYSRGSPIHFDVENKDDNHSIERRIEEGEITASQAIAWQAWDWKDIV